MTEQEQKAFDAAYADALKQSRPGTIRDIARLCYESAITAANAVSVQYSPVGKCGVLSKSEPKAQEPVAFIRGEWSGSAPKVLTFEGPPQTLSPRDELVNTQWTPLYDYPEPMQAEPAGCKLVPVEPDEFWMYRAIRHYQPHVEVGSKVWLDCARELLHWHLAVLAAAPEAKK